MRKIALMVMAAQIIFAQRPEFEVASIKENKNNGQYDTKPRRSGDLVIMNNTRLYSMILYAYHLDPFQLVADQQPQQWWDWYDVQARAPAGATEDQVRLMMQSLLEDRFKLKVHRESREMAVYRLLRAKGELRLKPDNGDPMHTQVGGKEFSPAPHSCPVLIELDGLHMVCRGATLNVFVNVLKIELSGPVIDETGLGAEYNFTLAYQSPNKQRKNVPDDVFPAPLLMDAIQSDLGLRLEKGKAQVEVLVIDRTEKLSAN